VPPSADLKLVALDLDGTLLRSDKTISQRNLQAITGLRDQSIKVVLASARPPRSTKLFAKQLGLATPTINYNGAVIHDEQGPGVIYHQPLVKELAIQAVELARKIDPQVVVSVERLDRWLTDRVDPTLLVETAKTSEPDYVGPIESCLTEDVTKLMLLVPPDRLPPITQAIERQFADQIGIHVSDSHFIQLVHPSVDKASALDWLCQHMNIAPEQVLAIGDAPNDIEMLRWAGVGLAVENAWHDVRTSANAIIPSNDHDGVAWAIDYYFPPRNKDLGI